jgi:hypothetical protein
MQFTDYIKKLQEGKIPPQFLKGKDSDKDGDNDNDKDAEKDTDKDEDEKDNKKSKGKFPFGKKADGKDDKKDEDLKEAYAYTHTWTKDELLEFISELEDDEVREVGDFLMGELMEEDEFEDEDFETGSEDEDELKEGHFFNKTKSQMDREKHKDVAQRKMKKKLLAKYYKKNKARIARKAKIYRNKAKKHPNAIFHHKGVV